MSAVVVDQVRVSGPIEGAMASATPDGSGLVTVGVETCQVIIVPNGSSVTGIRFTEGGDEWESTDGFYFVRIAAEPGGTASLVLESGAVSAQYRLTAPGSLRSSIPIGSVPIAIAFEATASRWRVLDTGHRRPIGSAIVWLGDPGSVPSGWLAAGSEVSRTTYSALFAIVGTTGGAGNGTTTFDVPDPGVLSLGIWIVYAGL